MKKKIKIFLGAATIWVLYTLNKYNIEVKHVYYNSDVKAPCILPRADPYDKSIVQYMWHPKNISCDTSLNLVYVNDSGYLHLNSTMISGSRHQIQCKYAPFTRQDQFHVKQGEFVLFESPTYLHSDITRVKCFDEKRSIIYDYLHESIDYKSVLTKKETTKDSQSQLSVFMFGLDSVSRLAADRHLPKSFAYVRDNLKGYVFNGQVKVGENTFPNVVPMLTGKEAFSGELPSVKEYFDNYPFLWNNYSEKGYVTYYAEDWPAIDTFSFYKGFQNQPTDHFMRNFYLAMEKVDPIQEFLGPSWLLMFENKGVQITKGSSLCYGNRFKHNIVISYLKRFIMSYKNKRRFAFSWVNELGHDYSNFLEVADEDIRDFFKWMKESKHLENSVLIYFSDHGLRTSPYRNTPIGRIEDKMPMVTIVIPDHIKKKYPHLHANMVANQNRLTTPYDIYETLSDILHEKFNKEETTESNTLPRGISLFSSVPKDRSCYDAGIAEIYCPCFVQKPISVTTPLVHNAAQFLVKNINSKLIAFRGKCANLHLDKVINAEKREHKARRSKESEEFSLRELIGSSGEHSIHVYVLVIQTLPGKALFEATIQEANKDDFKVVGQVQRINKYGNQSSCIHDTFARSFCYCEQ